MKVTFDWDDEETQMALADWAGYARLAAQPTARDIAEHIKRKAQELGSVAEHPPGTKTPAPPGAPAGRISGHLVDTYEVHDLLEEDAAEVGPTAHYGRIQELGGWMQGHPMMRWFEDGAWHRSRGHSLPARPTLKPATEFVLVSGEALRIVIEHYREIQDLVTRG